MDPVLVQLQAPRTKVSWARLHPPGHITKNLGLMITPTSLEAILAVELKHLHPVYHTSHLGLTPSKLPIVWTLMSAVWSESPLRALRAELV